ncbi:hypothetical protein [Allobaculum sp. Allo2]|uniref:hypothetical protein n=1 Tax=Allobaculum sp. Allo2 TaxID=2853432 RepID=UPI001F61BC81|nr:hypothetical protein [Allobaculum sp. Allo2]UNT94130.1 hypothetical protein KWG61_05705 [Allobaculum sp. Allo2]
MIHSQFMDLSEDDFESQEDVDQAAEGLVNLLDLVKTANAAFTALNANKDLDLSRYTEASAQAYRDARTALEAELEKPEEASQTVISAKKTSTKRLMRR